MISTNKTVSVTAIKAQIMGLNTDHVTDFLFNGAKCA